MKPELKKFIIPIVLGLLSVFSIIYASENSHTKIDKAPVAKRGMLNIGDWNFNKQGRITLSGEWEIYIGKFIEPNHFEDNLNAEGKEYLVSSTTGHNLTNGTSTNIATLRMDIKTSGKERNFGFKIDTGNRPFQLWIDRKLIADGFKEKIPVSAKYHIEEKRMEILLHISNFSPQSIKDINIQIGLPRQHSQSILIKALEPLLSLRDLLKHNPLFAVGILLIMGYLIGKLVSKIHLPEITGFIVAGMIMGDTVTGVIPLHMGESLKVVTEVALGFIALTIGGEFSLSKLKRLGKEVVIITAVQLLFSFGAVVIGLTLFGMELPFALLLGAIASATAPAATVAIVQSLRAKGLFIDYLYGVVALDDAGCVILFGIMFAIASSMLGGGAGHGGAIMILHALGEVLLSILIGFASGFLIHVFTRKKNNNNEIMIISLGIIFLSTALAIVFHLSPLLTNMGAGAILINLSARNHRIFRILEPLTPPIYALFFVVAGTELNPGVLLQSGTLLLGTVFIIMRALGKYFGVITGCAIAKVKKPIKGNLGFCMLPQAGVAIGLVLLIQTSPVLAGLPADKMLIVSSMINIVLLSVFVNELIGPPLSKMAIIKGNEMEV